MLNPDRLAELFAKISVLREESTELQLRARALRDVSSEFRIHPGGRFRLKEALRGRSEIQAEDDPSV